MPITKFEVLNRWSGKVQFTAEIDCSLTARAGIKVGLAVKWAYSTRADLRGADLSGAVLRGAVLTDADLRDADLSGAVLRGAVLRDVPVIPNIDMTILAAVENGGKLDMTDWHRCETTHCRAGWAITLAGAAGVELEKKHGSAGAGALIYAASRPDKPIPNFYASNDDALADIKACAAEQSAACGME